MTPSAAIILPARFHSTRFPGKPLAVVSGRPLIEWVHRRASLVSGISRVIVATDHDDIADVVKAFGGEVVMTGDHLATGTDRVAAVAQGLEEDIIVNLQGDEPVFPPALVEEMVAVMRTGWIEANGLHRSPLAGARKPSDASHSPRSSNAGVVDIVTACHPITNDSEIASPNVVKVVTDSFGRALYFSRSVIPHARDAGASYHRHIGIYVFRKTSLLEFSRLAASPLEQAEGLEQLRALENGMTIGVVKTDYSTVGVDVPEDIKSVEKALATTYAL